MPSANDTDTLTDTMKMKSLQRARAQQTQSGSGSSGRIGEGSSCTSGSSAETIGSGSSSKKYGGGSTKDGGDKDGAHPGIYAAMRATQSAEFHANHIIPLQTAIRELTVGRVSRCLGACVRCVRVACVWRAGGRVASGTCVRRVRVACA